MIKDNIYGYAGGTVGRTFDTKNGRAFVLEVAREGSQYPDRVTVWGAADTVGTGDRVMVKGWLSWRREVKDDKTYFNVSMNKPEIVEHEPASAPQAPEQAEPWASTTPGASDVWNTPGSYNDETPF